MISVAQVSPLKRFAALLAIFVMVAGVLLAFQVTTTGPAAHAANCSVSSNASPTDSGSVTCPADWTSGINIDLGGITTTPGECSGVLNCGKTPYVDPNIDVYTYNFACAYSGAHGVNGVDAFSYPIKTPANCVPQYSAGVPVCSGATTCNIPGGCPVVGGKSALKVAVSSVTQRVYDGNNKLVKTVKTVRGYCVYPTESIKSTEKVTNASTSGYCAIHTSSDLYRSDSSSTITTGVNGKKTAGSISTGNAGSGIYVYHVGDKDIPLNYKGTAAELVKTCQDGSYPFTAKLPKDTVNGGTILGYYRLTNLTTYIRCYITSYGKVFNAAPQPTCIPSPTYKVYDHNRFTNTCRYGLVDGVHTEYAKYFDPSTCSTTWQCNIQKTKIGGQPNSVLITRNGDDIPVNYGTFSVTGKNITVDKTSYQRRSNVVDGSTPFYGDDQNDPKQYFKFFAAGKGTTSAGTPLAFNKWYYISAAGQTVNSQFYWASDSDAPWHMTTQYRFSAKFTVPESTTTAGGTSPTPVLDDAVCPSVAQSANVNVLRSVNIN